MKDYTIIIEKTEEGFSAYAPDLPGCITVGDTVKETKQYMKEAIDLYIDTLKAQGKPLPEPTTLSDKISA